MTESKSLTTVEVSEAIEQVLIGGDLARLSPPDRVAYYKAVCKSLGLNPLTKPFDYLSLNGRLVLYATRTATDQLRRVHGVSVQVISRERLEDVYVVTARATDQDGRSDESIGAVCITGLRGDALANALMKAETKGKRRATLSLVGLGWLDETEVETVREARRVDVTAEGEIVQPAPPPPVPVKTEGNGKDRWSRFWPEAKRLGFKTSEEIHQALQVDSMKVWEAAGKTLDDAIIALEAIVAKRKAAGAQATVDLFGEAPK